MDLPEEPITENVPKIEEPAPTIIKQYYSIPSPIITYMLKNASAINYFKLYQSCKLLHHLIEEKYGPQADIFEAGKLYSYYRFFSVKAVQKEIKIRGFEKSYNEFSKNQKLWLRKRLMLVGLSGSVTSRFLKKLNLSTIKEVYLLRTAISIDEYKALLVPSIEILYGSVCDAADGFDIISYTLKELPNLKVFKLPWQRNLTTFTELNAIKRECRFQKAEIYDFPGIVLDKDILSGFVAKHMARGSSLYLDFTRGIQQSTKNKYQHFADEFNMSSSAKIMIR